MMLKTHLIREASMLATGATIHDTNEAIAWYRAAFATKDDPRQESAERHLKAHIQELKRWRK